MSENIIKIKIRRPFRVKPQKINDEIEKQLKARNRQGATLEVSVVGARAMQNLNKKFLNHDYSTDVLSFPLEKIPGETEELVGTIVICNDKVNEYAKARGTSYEQEFIFLLDHGIDHLLGIHHD